MDLLHRLIVIAVAVVVFGGGGVMAYKLYLKPQMSLRAEERRMELEAAELAAAPEPAVVDFEQATSAAAAAISPDELRTIWERYLAKHPDAPQAAEARAVLGPLNIRELFSKDPDEGKALHTVIRGDSLYRIARQHGVTIDLIARANNLQGTMLQVGDTFVIPQPEITVTVDRAAGTLRLDNRGTFLREYPLLSSRLPGLAGDATAEARVVETVVTGDGGKRLTYGQKGYDEGTRMIVLSAPALSISGAAPETPAEELPAGLVVKDENLGEIFVLLRRGVPVTIR